MPKAGDDYIVMAGHRASHQWLHAAATDGWDKPGHDVEETSSVVISGPERKARNVQSVGTALPQGSTDGP